MNIKISILLCSFLSILSTAKAQKPEPVYSFVTELKPTSWYKEQASLWNAEINKNKKNAIAWYNYYMANRNLIRIDTTDTRTRDEKKKSEVKIVDDMNIYIPESFEYNLCKWKIGGNDPQYKPFLLKAAALGEDRYELVAEMIVLCETERNIKLRDKYSNTWYHSPLASPGLLNYNYNVIIGLKPNAILLTVGDNDTYPLWQLQAQGIRRDVTVLNLSLLYVDAYRDKVFEELEIPKWDTSMFSKKPSDDINPYHKEIIKHIASNKKKLSLYVTLTTGQEYIKSVEENLYLIGLSYEYSKESIDNIASLKKNFEKTYALDYIEHTFYKDISEYYTNCVNQNYIVPMLKLYDHYKEAGETQKQEWIRKKILSIVKDSEYENTVKEHLK